jgi:DNA (cytosine-5)-methyltransferase 1
MVTLISKRPIKAKKINVDNPFKSPAVISFCPGILGIERGLKRAGVHPRVVAYVEIEAFIIANLVAGMEAGILDPAPIWTDVKTFPREYFFRRIHGIIGGYPCTPFSLAGQRKGENDDRHLWPYISAAISSIEPIWCFFENVDDHLSMGYDIVYKDLQRMGYRVEAGVYSAEEVGATHERQRLFIMAIASCELWDRSWAPWRGRNEHSNSSEELANASGKGYKGLQSGLVSREGTRISRSIAKRCKKGGADWPAGQGIYQHSWEEPRTVESGLGSAINGYNFREDLLRALGNSVVEQTAELAFIDLLQKHLKWI